MNGTDNTDDEPNPHLDNLIAYLNESSSEDDSEDVEEDEGMPGSGADYVECYGCRMMLEKCSLKEHIVQSDQCFAAFKQQFRVSSLNEVLIIMMPCIFCPVRGNIKLRNHLGKSHLCLEGFKNYFLVDEIGLVLKKVGALKRRSNYSRGVERRKMENLKRKNEENASKTEAQLMSDFRQRISFSNYRMCYKCKGSYGEYSAVEVDDKDVVLEEIPCTQSVKRRKRMGSYWICKWCTDSPSYEETSRLNDGISIDVIEDENSRVYYPSIEIENSEENDFIQEKTYKSETIFSPCSTDAVKKLNFSGSLKTVFGIPQMVHTSGRYMSSKGLSKMYTNQLLKYYKRLNYSTTFVGKIVDRCNNLVSSLEPIIDDFRIRGSDGWFKNRVSDMKCYLKQFGRACLKIAFEVPFGSSEFIATCFVNNGFCLSATFVGDLKLELKTKYVIHISHKSHEPCPENCEKVDLDDYFHTVGFQPEYEVGKFIPTYLASVNQKMKAFVDSFIKPPSSPFHSEAFVFSVKFDIHGLATIEGTIWPCWFNEFNLHSEDETVQNQFIKSVNSRLSTTTDPSLIREQFGVSVQESIEIANVVRVRQVDSITENNINLKGRWPCLITMLKFTPEIGALSNHTEAAKLRRIMLDLLNELSVDELQNMKTLDWLEDLSEWYVTLTEDEDDENFCAFTIRDVHFQFVWDEKLASFVNLFPEHVFIGVYHYALCCSEDTQKYEVVIKRESLLSIFTSIYAPLILSAVQAKMKVSFINGMKSWESSLSSRECSVLSRKIDPQLYFNHKEVSLVEFYSYADAKTCVDVSSNSITYVNTSVVRSPLFKISKEEGMETYRCEGNDDRYEIVYSNVDRHRMRRNGENVLLAEVGLLYRFVGAKKSKELQNAFSDNVDGIPESDIKGAWNDTMLPKYILSANGDALELLRRRHVLKYPSFSGVKSRYSKVLLFYPLKPNELIELDELGIISRSPFKSKIYF